MRLARLRQVLAAFALCWIALPALAAGPEEVEAEARLQAVREEIRAIAAELEQLSNARGNAEAGLRDSDRSVAAGVRALREADAAVAAQAARLQALEADEAQLAERLAVQREALGSLLRSAYALGRHQRLKLLLAQDRIEQAARALAYHRVFQRDSVQRIEALLDELAQLAALREQVDAARVELQAQRSTQAAALAALEQERGARAALVAELDRRQADRNQRLAALARDERELVALLARLRDALADIPRQLEGERPLRDGKGKLPRPLPGPVQAAFGARLPDGRQSQGWLIHAEAGAEVRAIAHGRVAFADWLRGYGLIAIVDHGDGYMSLYAQNDALLAEAGAWVGAGEVLATVGSSGGQGRPALYFELRHEGRPVDPAAWLAPR